MSVHGCESSGGGLDGVEDDDDEDSRSNGVTDPGCLLWAGLCDEHFSFRGSNPYTTE